MPKDLLKLFEDEHGRGQYYHRLKGTKYTYVHRKFDRWLIFGDNLLMTRSKYVSFEHVLDSVNEEMQTQLLFHLDYFLAEVKEEDE